MAEKQVETKVVQVRFDNSKFSKNIDKTIKQCNKFDKSLQFKGSKDNIRDIQKALDGIELKKLNKELDQTEGELHKISVGFKDIIKIKLISKAIDTVIRKTNTMIKSMLGINNVVAGWQQYETQMTNVGGILNQVESKGYTLNDVADAMERLRWYTDETSYSFTTLSNGIRQFVIAGVDLNKAAEAAMGVTNLAGSAKVFDEYKIQSAMDAVSKAMQTGYMDTLKWTSLTNTAGVVTEEFSQKLLDEAVAQGKLVKSAAGQYKTKKSGKLVTTENIRSTLSDKWLTSDILANVMDEYASASTAVEKYMGLMSDDTEESLKEINKMIENTGKQYSSWDELKEATYVNEAGVVTKVFENVSDITSMTARQAAQALEHLGYAFDDVSLKAFYSAQETTSFSQAVGYVKKAISTQWANIFEQIFGNYDTAKGFWSDISDQFYEIFITPFEGLTELFTKWSSLTEGGAEDFRNTVKTIITIIGQLKTAVASGFKAVFGSIDETVLKNITLTLQNFFNKISNGLRVLTDDDGNIIEKGPLFKVIESLSKVLASLFKIINKIRGTITKTFVKLFVALEPVFEIVADTLEIVADGVAWVADMIDEIGILDQVANGLATVLGWLAKGIKNVITWIKGKIDLEKVTKGLATAFGWLRTAIEWVVDKFVRLGTAVRDWWTENEIAQKTLNFFKTAIDKVKGAFNGFTESTEEAKEGMENISEAGEEAAKKTSWITRIKNGFIGLGNFFKDTFLKFKGFLQEKGILDGLAKFFDGLKSVFGPIVDMLVGWWKQLGTLAKEDPTEALKTIAKAILIVIGIFVLLKAVGFMRAGQDVLWQCYYTLKAFKKKILAERWKALGSALLLISASVLILAYTMKVISNIPTGKAWSSLAMVVIILAAYAGILAIMNSPKLKVGLKAGLSISLEMAAMAIGLAVFLNALGKAIALTNKESQGTIWKAYGLIAAMTALLVLISLVLFRKLKKNGLFKGGEVIKGPGVMSLIKTFLVVYAILKMATWFTGEIAQLDDDQLKRAAITLGGIIVSVGIILGLTKVLSKIVAKSASGDTINTQWVKVNIASIAIVALAAYYVFKQASNLTPEEIKSGSLSLLAIFGSISIILIAMGTMNRIAGDTSAQKVGIKMAKTMISIALAALLCVAAFKILNKTSWDEIWAGGLFIIALYAIIGGIAVALSKVSKTVEMTIGKDGMKKVGVSSPSGKMILAVASLVLVCVVALRLLKSIEWDEFWPSFWKLAALIGLVAVVSAIILRASKSVDGNAVVKAVASLFGGIIAAIAIALLLKYDVVKPKEFWIAYGIVAAFAGFLLAFLAIIGVINKYLKMAAKDYKSIAVSLVLLMASLWAMIGLVVFVNKNFEGNSVWKAVGVVGVCVGAIVAMLLGVAFLSYALKKNGKTGKQLIKDFLMITAVVIALGYAMEVITKAIKIISTLDEKGSWRGLAITGIIIGGLIVVVSLIGLAAKIFKKAGIDKGMLALISMMMLAISASILIIAYAIQMISDIYNNNKEGFTAAVITVAAIAAVLLIMILTLTIVAEKVLKSDATAILIGLTAMVLSIAIAILAIAAALLIVSLISQDDLIKAGKALGIAIGVLTGVMLLLGNLLKTDKQTAIGGMAMLMGIAVAAVAFALAIKILGEMDWVDILKGLGALILVIVLFGAAVALLGAVGESGIGEIGAGLLLAIAAAVLIISVAVLALSVAVNFFVDAMIKLMDNLTWEKIGLLAIFSAALLALGAAGILLTLAAPGMLVISAAMLLLSEALNRTTDSLIKLINEADPEKADAIRDLGAALMTLAGGTITNALANFGASILNVGTALGDLASGAIDKLREFFGIKSKDEKELEQMKKQAEYTALYAEAMGKMSNINADEVADKIKTIAMAIGESSEYTSGISNLFGLSFNTFIINLEKLKEVLEDMPDPVIKPVLDLSEFNAGMAEIQNGTYNIRGKLYNDYAPIASMPSMSAIKSATTTTKNDSNNATANGVGNKAEAITINQEFMLTDALAYSYYTQRATANAIADASRNMKIMKKL